MEIIKRRILLEDGISRKSDTTYGTMTASTFQTKIFLTQTIDMTGIFTDIDYVNEPADFSILINKLGASGFTFPFMSGQMPASQVLTGFTKCLRLVNATPSDWYGDGDILTANTEGRITELKSYSLANPYIPNFNIGAEVYNNYQNFPINGVSRIISNLSGDTRYVFDANDDAVLGTPNQSTGLLYRRIGNQASRSRTKNMAPYEVATVQFKAEGWNMTNTSLSAITKEEYLMGILYPPEVFSDVFIDRGATTVNEMHLRLSEVESVEHLEKYGNGFYNIVTI